MIETHADVDDALTALRSHAGSPPDLRRRDAARGWLLAHADRAFAVVLARARAAPSDPALLELLGQYGRAETSPLLLGAFGRAATRNVAALGLGLSPDPAARAALRAALDDADRDTVIAALAGLAASGDKAACADIAPRLAATDAQIRWAAVETGTRLGCIDRATLETIAATDADDDVRRLAAGKLG